MRRVDMHTKRKIFLDVGGHFGETLEEVLKPKYGFDLVHCFEPIPDCYARIKSVFASEISAGKLQVHNFGLSNRTGTQNLYGTGPQKEFGEGMGASIFADKVDIDESHFIECRFVSASEFFAEHLRADDLIVLKLNCEGAEVLILRDLVDANNIHDIDFIMIDFDVSKIPSQKYTKNSALDMLQTVGYTNFIAANDIGTNADFHYTETTALWLSLMPIAKRVVNMSAWESVWAKMLARMPRKMRKLTVRKIRKASNKIGKAFGAKTKRSQ